MHPVLVLLLAAGGVLALLLLVGGMVATVVGAFVVVSRTNRDMAGELAVKVSSAVSEAVSNAVREVTRGTAEVVSAEFRGERREVMHGIETEASEMFRPPWMDWQDEDGPIDPTDGRIPDRMNESRVAMVVPGASIIPGNGPGSDVGERYP